METNKFEKAAMDAALREYRAQNALIKALWDYRAYKFAVLVPLPTDEKFCVWFDGDDSSGGCAFAIVKADTHPLPAVVGVRVTTLLFDNQERITAYWLDAVDRVRGGVYRTGAELNYILGLGEGA